MARPSQSLILVVTLALLFFCRSSAQTPTNTDDPWKPVRFLLGTWEGISEGEPGKGTVRRQYQLILRDQFIEERNTSTYLPQEKNPAGEVHDHIGYIGFDRARKRMVLRQFHVERFVTQYVQDPESSAGTLVFVSEAIENAPPSWRARETYIVHGPDEFEEIFELAQAGKGFEVYTRSKFRRVR